MSATYSVEVRITPRQGILDPEGETIARALENLGYDGVSAVRAGRIVRMEVDSPSEGEARDRVVKMCEELIANPVIEDFEVLIERAG
ncbi:MAG: phosphoribosylformylglycinamidine synthase subunit PurS [Gemmatimonadota bacterium]